MRLGFNAQVVENQLSSSDLTILLGWNLLSPDVLKHLPPTAIIYNLEQLHEGSPWLQPTSMDIFKRDVVIWDYSKQNIRFFESKGITNVHYMPVGYVPELTRIRRAPKDIDVFHYGSLNERRQAILEQLKQKGLTVYAPFGLYGKERDSAIARAKVVVNVHFYETNMFETVRVSYLLSNRVAVVSEESVQIDSDGYTNAVKFVPYNHIVEACVQLVENDNERDELAHQGFTWFSSYLEADILRGFFNG